MKYVALFASSGSNHQDLEQIKTPGGSGYRCLPFEVQRNQIPGVQCHSLMLIRGFHTPYELRSGAKYTWWLSQHDAWLTYFTLVGVVSSDVSRSSCTTSFPPCCSIFSPSHVFFQGCPRPFLDVINVLHPRMPPSSFPRHHSENASLYKITLIVSACMSKESHFSFDNLGKEFAWHLWLFFRLAVCDGPQQVRSTSHQRHDGWSELSIERHRSQSHEDSQWHPLPRLRASMWTRGTLAAGERTGKQHHARYVSSERIISSAYSCAVRFYRYTTFFLLTVCTAVQLRKTSIFFFKFICYESTNISSWCHHTATPT